VELIQAGGEILLSVVHKLFKAIWNKEEFPDQWLESIIVPIHKKGDRTDYNSNYHEISLLTSYKILLNILLSWLSPYILIDEITGDKIFCICRILERKCEYTETVHQLFIEF
jgi:hypothetical protein